MEQPAMDMAVNTTSYQYSPNEPIWAHSNYGDPVKATFVKYNKKTVTIIVHFKVAGDSRHYVKIDEISPRNTGGESK